MREFVRMRLFVEGSIMPTSYIDVTPLIYKKEEIEGLYISMSGDVYSSRHSRVRGFTNTVIKCNYTLRANYPCVIYRETDTRSVRRFSVHIACASTFSPIEEMTHIRGVPDSVLQLSKADVETLMFLYNTLQVNHINHCRGDYAINNLEWVTARANIDAYHEYAGFK